MLILAKKFTSVKSYYDSLILCKICSLDQNVFSVHRKFQMPNFYSKRDNNVKKIKVKNDFFEFSVLSYFCPCYISTIFISTYMGVH